MVAVEGLQGQGPDVAVIHGVGVLEAVQLLDHHLVGPGDELHPGDVVLARVARYREPLRPGGLHIHDAHLHGRIRGPGLRIRERDGEGIKRIYIIDHQEGSRPFRIGVPIGDPVPGRIPAPAVVAAQFLFVHPVEVAVDKAVPAVEGKPPALSGGDVLHIEVVVIDIAELVPRGRQLPVHHPAGLQTFSELAELAGGNVQKPVVAPGVAPPDPTGIRVNHQLRAVLRPFVPVHPERLLRPFRDEGRCGDDDRLRERGGIHADQSVRRESGIGAAVLQPRRLRDAPGPERAFGINVFEGDFRLGLQRRGQAQQCR